MKFLLNNTSFDFSKQVYIMGILNVTPDSFSDGGKFTSKEAVLSHAQAMVDAGADIIDIGGESTRPFAEPVALEEELNRVIPAITSIRKHFDIPISIDTTKSEVAAQALAAGADIINDISAFRFDSRMVEVAQSNSVPVIIMHMQGTPADMQIKPDYDDIIEETLSFFQERIQWLTRKGIDQKRIIIDPGIGFGKTVAHNLLILKRADEYSALGCPVLIGHSRKSFIGKILDNDETARDISTAVISSLLSEKKVSIVRVHDVEATKNALLVSKAINNAC